MRMYEEKMYLRSAPTVLAWRYYIHNDGSVEFLKTPTVVTSIDRQIVELTTNTIMRYMNDANIADMKCIFIG